MPIASKTTASGASRKKTEDEDSSSDFDFGLSKPKKRLMTTTAKPKSKAVKPKVTKAPPKKKTMISDIELSDEESGGKKKTAHTAV